MKLASYRGTRAFPNGIANILIRLRLRGDYSHSELIFEPSDLVDQYLPDGDSSETSEGLWAFSSVAAEKLPEYSKVRGSEIGGVRFKRIKFNPMKWDIVDIPKGIEVSVEKNVISIKGISKQNVGDFAANVRKLRKTNPYSGKGIHYQGEHIIRKTGKKVASSSS